MNEKLRNEYVLLIEELSMKVISAANPGSDISISVKKHLGAISATIKCPGKPVFLESESNSDFSGQIIREYSESLRQSYSFGVNEIIFTTSFSSNELLMKNMISLISAVLIGLLVRFVCTPEQISWTTDNITLPIVLIFIRGMQTVAVPVAFFSLIAFVVTIRRTFDRNNKTIRLSIHYVFSSIIAVAVAMLTWVLFKNLAPACDLSKFRISEDNFIGGSLKAFLTQVVSTNIIEPFMLSNPIPFLINAILTGLAASSVFGKSGEIIQNIINAINDLFTKMMNIIYSTIPFFIFVAVLDLSLEADVSTVKMIMFQLGGVYASVFFLMLIYIFRLVLGGVNVASFFRNYGTLLLENLKIASNIDSFPYNKRILARKMSLSRDYLSESLKLGILLNMDGNCLSVTIVLMNLITAVGVSVSPMKYIGMAIIMLLFSMGAPNQPGSFLLGMIILMSFVGISSELIVLVLIFEAVISKLYSFLNAAGDIFTLAIEDERYKRKHR